VATGGYPTGGSIYVSDNTFAVNQGGVITTGTYSTITNNVFTGNSAGNGGALSLGDSATVSAIRSLVILPAVMVGQYTRLMAVIRLAEIK
jgi:predicted outer membrane repeat protein